MSYEVRRRIAITVASIVAARLLLYVPLPLIDADAWRILVGADFTVSRRMAIGGLGLLPYAIASVLTTLVLAVRRRGRDGSGPREIHVVLLAIAVALAEGFSYVPFLETVGPFEVRLVSHPGALFRLSTVLSLTAGMMVQIGLARLISTRGIGNGAALLLGVHFLGTTVHDMLVGARGDGSLAGEEAIAEEATAPVLLAIPWIVAAVLVLRARWDAGGLIRDPGGAQKPLALCVAGVGLVGINVAESVLRLPAAVAPFLAFDSRLGLVLGAFEQPGLFYRLPFVALSFGFTALFTAWAYGPSRFEQILVRHRGPAAGGSPWLDEAGYHRRLDRIALPLALAVPATIAVWWALTDGVPVPMADPLTLVVLTAMVMDTERQWRLHHRMAIALAPEARAGVSVPCLSCGASLRDDSTFCPACGAELVEGATCEQHPAEPCEARCVVCRRTLCASCRRSSDGRSVCEAHGAVVLVEGWAVVASPATLAEAELLRQRIEARGPEAVVLANTIAPLYGTHGLFEISRLLPLVIHPEIGGAGIRLLVPPETFEKALEALADRPPVDAIA